MRGKQVLRALALPFMLSSLNYLSPIGEETTDGSGKCDCLSLLPHLSQLLCTMSSLLLLCDRNVQNNFSMANANELNSAQADLCPSILNLPY